MAIESFKSNSESLRGRVEGKSNQEKMGISALAGVGVIGNLLLYGEINRIDELTDPAFKQAVLEMSSPEVEQRLLSTFDKIDSLFPSHPEVASSLKAQLEAALLNQTYRNLKEAESK